jgi:hypothetical protein
MGWKSNSAGRNKKIMQILVGNILKDSLLKETERIMEYNFKINVDCENWMWMERFWTRDQWRDLMS